MLCTSSFVDDVMFSHNGVNGPESETTCRFRPVLQVMVKIPVGRKTTLFGRVHQGRSLPSLTASCLFCVIISFDLLMHVCFHRVRCSFFSTMLGDWLEKNCLFLCQISVPQSVSHIFSMLSLHLPFLWFLFPHPPS